jgi:REP element-mobilizing transposase RayT
MSKYHTPLFPGHTYHLFNRAVGNEKLFKNDDNYRYFLSKMSQHILPIADVFTYSLMPNHFHLLVRIKDEKIISTWFEIRKKKSLHTLENSLPDFIMEQFSNWFNGYTKAFNKQHGRKGSLFLDYMKRSVVENESDFTSFVFYIHKNAVHHGLCKKIGEWKYDGYQALLSERPSLLLRNEVIEWFGSIELFIKFHEQPVELKSIDPGLHLFDPNQ